MIRFFKINHLFTIIAAFILLLVIYLPVLTTRLPMIVPELEWMLAGERMSRGFVLYTQTWTDISPLAALFYWLLDALFGRSQLAYQITAFLVVIFQAVFLTILYGKTRFIQKSQTCLCCCMCCVWAYSLTFVHFLPC